jgi:general secretion pathway protein N
MARREMMRYRGRSRARGEMLRSGTILGLMVGLVALAGLPPWARAATDPTAVIPVETTINGSLEPGIEAPRPASPTARGVPPATGNPLWAVPLRSLSATRERPIFSPSRRAPTPPVIAAPFVAPVTPPPKPPEPDQPLLTLIGTIVGETDSVGVFIDQVTHNVIRLKTGEEHAGWLLRSIQGREATFQKDLRDATLALPAPGATEQAVEPSIGVPVGASAAGTWMDGDGQMISPPPRRSVAPIVAPAVVQGDGL